MMRIGRRIGAVAVWIVAGVGLLDGTPASGQTPPVVAAAAAQAWDEVERLLDQGMDVNATRADGATALLWAAHWERPDVIERLLTAGAAVDAADDHGVTPLERAAENASAAVVTALLDGGADPNVARTSGLTPLMVAARTGSLAIVELLLDRGADVDAATVETGSTALMWAVAAPHPELVTVLLDAGADPRRSTVKGFTPLMYAARNGDIATARVLVAAGVDLDAPSADGTHVLPFTLLSAQAEFAHFLLEEGADPAGAINGIQALHVAAGNVNPWLGDWYRRHGRGGLYAGMGRRQLRPAERLGLVTALLDRGADPDARIATSAMVMNYIGYPTKGAFEPFSCGTGDLRGATPLWVAAYDLNGARGLSHLFTVIPSASTTSVEVVGALLAAGADQHLTTDDGTTPFMVAAGLGPATYTPRQPRGQRSRSAEAAVRVLLDAGAAIDARNEADFTALHGAAMRGLNEVIEYLVAHGANIDARDFRGRTAYRLAEGAKQSFQFQSWPETAVLLAELGANTALGIPGTVQERLRDVPADVVGDAQP